MGLIRLLVLPSILMGVAILVIPRLSSAARSTWQRNLIVGAVLILIVAFFITLAMPIHAGCSKDEILFLIMAFGPIPLAGIAGFLMHSGLRDWWRISWWHMGGGLALFAMGCLLLRDLASGGRLGPVIAFLVALSATGVAIVTALWMVWSLPRWRKLAALLPAIVLPAALFVSIWIGEGQSPEEITQRNGDTIAQALERYHAETGIYPAELTELVPTCLVEIPEALTTQGTGWLYTSDSNQYTLGYWHYPDKLGVILCLHSSTDEGWQCQSTYSAEDWTPFSPVPTPTVQ
jgi:hypothetical protein